MVVISPDDDLEETSEEGTNADSSSNEQSEKPTESNYEKICVF